MITLAIMMIIDAVEVLLRQTGKRERSQIEEGELRGRSHSERTLNELDRP